MKIGTIGTEAMIYKTSMLNMVFSLENWNYLIVQDIE